MGISGVSAVGLGMFFVQRAHVFNIWVLFAIILGLLYEYVALTISPTLASLCTLVGYSLSHIVQKLKIHGINYNQP